MNIDPLDEELDDARLLGREQLVPDGGEIREQDGDLAFRDVVLTLPLRRCPGPGNQLRGGQQFLDVIQHGAFDIGGGYAGDLAVLSELLPAAEGGLIEAIRAGEGGLTEVW
jgi:hypothetical protein